MHAGGALVDKDKLDSLQAKLFRSQLSMEPPPAGLLQHIIDDVLAALGAAAGDTGRGVTAGAPGGEEEAEGVAEARGRNDRGSGVSWDRVRDPAYLMCVVTVRAPPPGCAFCLVAPVDVAHPRASQSCQYLAACVIRRTQNAVVASRPALVVGLPATAGASCCVAHDQRNVCGWWRRRQVARDRLEMRGDLAANHLYFWADPPMEAVRAHAKLLQVRSCLGVNRCVVGNLPARADASD